MTQIFPVKVTCPICENELEIYQLLSTNRFGAPDLDLRPPEMMRSTINSWTHECSECGYVSRDFNEKPLIDKEFLETESYKSCDGYNFENNLSKTFYREHLINKENVVDQFYSLLHCAWACDDANDEKNAVKIRKHTIGVINTLIDNGEDPSDLRLIKSDFDEKV